MTDAERRASATKDGPTGASPRVDRSLEHRLATARRHAAIVLFVESFWRAAIWPVGIVALFVAVAWLGVFAALSDTARLALAAGFGLAFLASFVAFRGLAWPRPAAALDRLEGESGLTGRPLHGLVDSLPATNDPVAAALWRAHLARLARAVPALRAGPPRPDLARRDVWALRPLLAMVLFVGFMAASGQHWRRVADVFAGARQLPVEAPRLDAWVTPPPYTGKPSMMLTGERAVAAEPDGRYVAPIGSTLSVRMARSATAPGPAPTVTSAPLTGQATPVEPKPGATALVAEYETKLAGDGSLVVTGTAEAGKGGGELARWRFSVTPDAAPAIRLTRTPEAQLTGALKLDYAVSDDFGVTGANAILTPAQQATAKPTRSLVPPPDFSLALPQAKGRIGTASTIRDLTQHPWAGAKVRLTLDAHDEAGQVGRSEPVEMVLPAKRLTKPLARAIIEQRRNLALDAESVGQVVGAIDALLIAPEKFINDAGHFFGLKMIDRALARATTDDQLRDVMDLMWTVARQIEDGDLSDVEKALRQAQENLRQAIEKGADEKEIARLTDELRKAMDRYLQEMAQRQQRNPQTARAPDQNTRTLRKQDLDRMLKRIEDLARTGSKEAAQQLLNQLQQMMENMQAGRPRPQGPDGDNSKMSEMLDKLAELMQRQQDLLDRTHKANPNGQQQQQRQGQRPGQRGQQGQGQQQPMTADQLAELLKQLEQGQGEAQQALKDLMEQMEQQGLGEDGEGGEPGARGKLGDAGEAMGRAGKALGRGRAGEALGPEGQALDALRQGAQGLVRELSRRQQQTPGEGPGEGPTANAGREDPLGRPRAQEGPDFSDSVKIPGEIDAERARKILEDIRGRLSQQTRPRAELDYLDRLLKGE